MRQSLSMVSAATLGMSKLLFLRRAVAIEDTRRLAGVACR